MEQTRTACGKSGEFNYCKWAKILVAIPALPLVALMGASLFEPLFAQAVGAVGSVAIVVLGAMWIDSIPLFQKKIRTCGKCEG